MEIFGVRLCVGTQADIICKIQHLNICNNIIVGLMLDVVNSFCLRNSLNRILPLKRMFLSNKYFFSSQLFLI